MVLQSVGISRLTQCKLGIIALALWAIIFNCFPTLSLFVEDNQVYSLLATPSATTQRQYGLSVVYPKWSDNNNAINNGVNTNSSWCKRPKSPKHGFYFAKTFKTGSSSSAAIHVRISRNVGKRKFLKKYCKHDYVHEFSTNRTFQNNNITDHNNGFVWTIVRNPQSRAISAYYFYVVGHAEQNNTEQNMLASLEKCKNMQALQLQYDPTKLIHSEGMVFPVKPLNESIEDTYFRHDNSSENIRTNILEHYNFVAVSERSEESFVVLKFLLDLNDGDIVLLSNSKAAGSWAQDWAAPAREGCFSIPQKPKELPPAVQHYLETGFVHHNADFLLHQAAMESLDRTIDAIGRDVFESALKRHRELKALVSDRCGSTAIYPCSATGQWQHETKDSCYSEDLGCGHQCVDRVLLEASK